MKISKDHFLSFFICFLVFIASTEVHGQNVVEKLKNHENTSHFAQALEDANLGDRLTQDGPFTLFAPSNRYFDELSNGQKSDSNLLLNHIFMGMATKRSLKVMSDITCLSGRTITVHENGGKLSVDSFVIVNSNIKADNGIIHIIDGVIK